MRCGFRTISGKCAGGELRSSRLVSSLADEGRRARVQLVELEAARERFGAVALQELVSAFVVEDRAALPASGRSDRTACEATQLCHGRTPLRERCPVPVGAVVEADRFADARRACAGLRRRAARGAAAAKQDQTADQRGGGKGCPVELAVQGLDGVVNHGHAAGSSFSSWFSMAAKQAVSSCSCAGPPVPTLELSHADGRTGAGGTLVTLPAVPSLPMLSCQQLPVFPEY